MSQQNKVITTQPSSWDDVLTILTDENNTPALFRGIYDAKNGNEKYMHGILTVMEFIACQISDEKADEFSAMFINNMIESEQRR